MTRTDVRGLWAEIGELQAARARAGAALDLARFRGEIAAFARQVLGVEHITPDQEEHFRAVAEETRVAAYGANGCGKTFDDAVIALYLVYVEGTLVIVTSAREGQLRDQFMRDVRILFQQAPDLDGELRTLGISRPDNLQSGIACIAAGETSRVRGYHAPRLAFLIEEAQGCPDWVFDVAEMMAIGEHDRVLVTGNCDRGGVGPFWKRCQTWRAVRFNSDAHPNVIEGRTVIPGGPTRASRAQRLADYGEDSPFFVASWLGLFPASHGSALVSRESIAAAVERWHQRPRIASSVSERLTLTSPPRPTVTHLSLDPARLGPDSTVLAVRAGNAVEELVVWGQLRTTESARRVVAEMERLGVPLDFGIVVDEPGLGGGVIDALIDLGVRVRPFNGVRPASRRGQETYANCRAECYGHLQARLERGTLVLPPDDLLEEELLALRWRPGPEGAPRELETKDEIRARLGRSPDRADAIAMAFTDDGYARLIA